MLPYSARISRYALALFFLAVLGYAYFEARGILFGPTIRVDSSATDVHDRFVRIEGSAAHIDDLLMNGKSIPVTETGAFSEPYLLAPGDNRIVLEARDRYGHTTRRVVEIVYDPPASATSAPAHAASSTPATAAPSAVAPGT